MHPAGVRSTLVRTFSARWRHPAVLLKWLQVLAHIPLKMSPAARTVALAAICLASLGRLRAATDAVQLDTDPNIFAVLAAINVAGYDDGVDLPDGSPVRRQLRDYLAKRQIAVLPDLKRFYEKHRQKTPAGDLAQYLSFALSVSGPPDFAWRTRDVEVPPDAMALAEFAPLLASFYQQADIGTLWKDAQPLFDRELEKYHSPLLAMVSSVDGYLRVPTGGYLGRHFRVFVDLLGAPEQVQTRSYGDDTFVVVSPSATPRVFDIRHAYLHFEIDPIVIKFGVDLKKKSALLDLVQDAPMEDEFKDDFVLLTDECLIKAVETRIDKNSSAIPREVRQGFILVPFFAEQLPMFEQQEQGLRFYVEDILNLLDSGRETQRAKNVKFDAAPLQRAAKTVAVAPPEPVLSPAGATLAKAEDLYTARKLDAARALYLKALEQKGAAGEHAQAWYGLARISALQNDPETATKLFQKTLTASPDPQTEAWSHVYLARLARAAGDNAAAVKSYQEALAVKGASERALEAARTESANLSK